MTKCAYVYAIAIPINDTAKFDPTNEAYLREKEDKNMPTVATPLMTGDESRRELQADKIGITEVIDGKTYVNG